MNNKKKESILKLDKIVFDKIEFERRGFKNDEELKIELLSNISQRKESSIYKVNLLLRGEKHNEYAMEISVSGYFRIESDSYSTDKLKNELITKNSVAILMPYLRSQVSILTAQPDVECVVLPPFNINNMLSNK